MPKNLDTILQVADIKLFSIGSTPVTIATLATVLLIVLFTLLVSRGVRHALEAGFKRRGVQEVGAIAAVSRLTHYAVLFVGFGIALQTAGIDLGTLFAAGAVFAVGIGFAMQTIVQNFVSGVILLVERAIKPGDVLSVEGKVVRVRSMGIRSTIAVSRDGEELIVPNSAIVQGTVINYTLNDSTYRVRVQVGVSYGDDMGLVRRTLEEVVAIIDKRWGDIGKESQVLMTGFGDNAVIWEVAVWMSDPWLERPAIAELHQEIWAGFQNSGIVIAFPQVDVHFDAPPADLLTPANARSSKKAGNER